MGWDIVGKVIGGVAPILGSVLGGPLGGAAGALLSGALGVGNDPGSVLAIIEKGGEAVTAAISNAEESAKAKWGYLTAGVESDAKQSESINATIQAEAASGVSWWHWRHLIGYATLLWAVFPVPPLAFYMATGNVPVLTSLAGILTALLSWFTILAGLCGYVAMDTSRRTMAGVTGTPISTVLGTILGAFGKKK